MPTPNEKRWYVVQVFSGFESKVKNSLDKCVEFQHVRESFGEIIVPTEEIVEIRKGQRRKSKRKLFPGYVLIQMVMNSNNWHLVKKVPYVLGFVGGSLRMPFPVTIPEVQTILKALQQSQKKPKPKTSFKVGESIRIHDGPFSDFHGTVERVDYEKNKLKVSVSVFGRSTPVELGFDQVEKNDSFKSNAQ